MIVFNKIKSELEKKRNLERARINSRFFKTSKGEYGEGDIFLGLTVPEIRIIARKYANITFEDIEKLIYSKFHEYRLVALLILVEKFKKTGGKKVVDFYLSHSKQVNNWDLVDLSAYKILGAYLFDKDKSILYKFARSKNLWQRRIAIISTFYFINNDRFMETLKISEILLSDEHELIHKAVGWMLREIGKKDPKIEEEFLRKHYKNMPRTMLRYAIEKFSEEKRRYYLKK